ncbi:MAG: RNA methyltransferase [Candidatus Bathyarchaeota archaeon]|nr:RNA methyltransferase [Candidatus Bathyarchaeota archaeon]
MNKKKLALAIPASIISDTSHLREKTSKIGLIGRAAAVFRVNEIIIYSDKAGKGKQKRETDLIALLLTYMDTPQFLRKCLFKLNPLLKCAGILPPLRTPHHPLNRKAKNLKVGEYREGVVVSETSEGMLVEIGVEHPVLIRETHWALGKRLTLQIIKADEPVEVQAVSRDQVPSYWGYNVTIERHSFGKLVRNGDFDLVIATSKVGARFVDLSGEIAEKWKKANYVLVGFGAPARGLYEIVYDEGLNLNEITHFIVNTIPEQGTETVRTEEAIFASLAILNLHLSW